jgi:hypothetical protein
MNRKQKNDELIRELNTLLDNNNPILAQLYELDDVESKNDNSYELNQLVENIALLRAKVCPVYLVEIISFVVSAGQGGRMCE